MTSEVEPRPGDIRSALVHAANVNATSLGKWRPVILIRHDEHSWQVAGLTTRSWFKDNTRRIRIPQSQRYGLDGASYLWGGRLARVAPYDIDDRLYGRVDETLARLLATQHTDITEADIAAMLAGTR